MSNPETDEKRTEESVYLWPCAFHNFSKLPSAVGQSACSDPFQIGNCKFRIELMPGGESEETKEYVSVYLELCEPSTAKIKFAMSVLVDTEKCFRNRESEHEFDITQVTRSFGCSKFVKRTLLITDVLAFTNDQLIILVELFGLDIPISPYQLHKMRSYGMYMNNEEHSDLKIVVGIQIIFAHKVILTSGNKVFTAMFSHNLKESKENILNVEDIEYEVMLELIRFIYTGQVCHLEKMPKKLLIAADKYGVDELKDHCELYLCQLLCINNVLEFLSFSDTYKVNKLRTKAITFFINHRKDIVKDDEFKDALKMIDIDLIAEIFITMD